MVSLKSIVNKAKAVVKTVASGRVPQLNAAPVSVTQAAKNIVSTVKAAVTGAGVFVQAKPNVVTKAVETAASHPFATAAVAATAASSAGRAVVAKVARSLTPTTVGGKVAAIAATPVVVGVLKSNPSAPLTAASSLGNVGENLGDLIAEPTKKNASKLFFDNPVIVGGAIAAGLGTAAVAAAPAVAQFLNTQAIQENTEAITSLVPTESLPSISTPPSVSSDGGVSVLPAAGVASPVPITSMTQRQTKTSLARRRRKTQSTTVNRQITRVNIINQSRVGGRYINKYSSVG